MKTETELLNAIETTPKDGALLSEYALWLAENGQEGEATRITDHLFQEPDGTIEGMKGHVRSVATVRQNSYVRARHELIASLRVGAHLRKPTSSSLPFKTPDSA